MIKINRGSVGSTDGSKWADIIVKAAAPNDFKDILVGVGTVLVQSLDKVNDDISLANTLSIIADPYVQEHFCNLRYVTLYGGKWKVTDASVEYPRIVLTLGGLWHGNETE